MNAIEVKPINLHKLYCDASLALDWALANKEQLREQMGESSSYWQLTLRDFRYLLEGLSLPPMNLQMFIKRMKRYGWNPD